MALPDSRQRFPAGFRWGTATSAQQIEGAVATDGRGPSIWDVFSNKPGAIAHGDKPDVTTDHYHRVDEDVALMKRMGVDSYRFSISWSRIFPQGDGEVNEAGLRFYEKLVDKLVENGITPFVTLYHWDLPQALHERGGWTNRETATAFAGYVDVVTKRLGAKVKNWMTLNEPWVQGFYGYREGKDAPGQTSLKDALQAIHVQYLAHGKAVPLIRQNSPGAEIGLALNLNPVYAATDSAEDKAAAARYDGHRNRWFMDPLYGKGYPKDSLALYGKDAPVVLPGDLETISAPIDFMGLNYYSPNFVANGEEDPVLHVTQVTPKGKETSGNGWMVHPEGIKDLIERVNKDWPVGKIYITENGAVYPDEKPVAGRVHDPQRTSYYERHLSEIQKSIEGGAPVKGYFPWSLLDNFEWASGFQHRFGLAYVDYQTKERTLKDTALWYGEVARANAIVPTPKAGDQ